MLRRQPRTVVTATLLAAVSAAPAWADCEQLRQQLVGQYGVFIRYRDGVDTVGLRCRQINEQPVRDLNALAQCNANYQILLDGETQAQDTYQQELKSYYAQCTTTATYGPNSAPTYAQDTLQTNSPYPYNPYANANIPPYNVSPFADQPSATIATPTVVSPSQFGNPGDAAAVNNFIGVLEGVGLGGRGRGRSFKSGDC